MEARPAQSARPAQPEDASEVVRLAAVMFTSMGHDTSSQAWRDRGLAQITSRLGDDFAVFVVDDPGGHGLAASGAGTIAARLPSPVNPTGLAGYVQWVATDPAVRRRGYGRAVLEALLHWYDERGVIVVELHATGDGEPLYRSLGFTSSGPVALRRRSPSA